MRPQFYLASIALGCCLVSPVSGQVDTPPPGGKATPQLPPVGKVVQIEAVIVETSGLSKPLQAGSGQSADKLLEQIDTLEKQGKLDSTGRIRLSTIEQQQAMVQFGQQSAVVTGRTRGGAGIGRPGL